MEYDIKAGDRVEWGELGTVVHVHDGKAWVDWGDRVTSLASLDILTKLPAFPERWINVHDWGIGISANSRQVADGWHGAEVDRLGVIHLHPDGTVEMEAP